MSIFGTDLGRNKLQEAIKKEFNVCELRPLNWLLGIQII